ncbi:unnamed protein product [Gongylonema pulchrum]|uniref:Integrase catalytic domain-containing protein n=1 Tax=Gongylonema pulchrum TaxID=637853 RepID=A0A183DNA3_9BILA|nr:unnamed protein product [Gongylonema pulchrum]
MPQSNGQAEKMAHLIKTSIEQDALSLDRAVMAYNYTPNSTVDGKSPSELKTKTPFDVYKPAKASRDFNSYQKMKRQFDAYNGVRNPCFQIINRVSTELWNGKRVGDTVVRFIGNTMAQINVQGDIIVRHFNQL